MFRRYIEDYIEGILKDILSDQRYTSLTPEKVSEMLVQVTLFMTNVFLSVIGALIVGFVAYILVTRHQTKSANVTKEIERQRLLHELEDAHQRITSKPCVTFARKEGFRKEIAYHFVVALTGAVKWDSARCTEYHWDTGDRQLTFTPDGGLLSSSVLHEALFWFRRVSRGFKAGLITRSDLYDMWRQVLPFVTDNRFEFLVAYFGGKKRRGTEDVEAIREVAQEIIRHCQESKKRVPLDYLSGRIDVLFYNLLPENLRNGIRLSDPVAGAEG